MKELNQDEVDILLKTRKIIFREKGRVNVTSQDYVELCHCYRGLCKLIANYEDK
jgi:hypothetical protein